MIHWTRAVRTNDGCHVRVLRFDKVLDCSDKCYRGKKLETMQKTVRFASIGRVIRSLSTCGKVFAPIVKADLAINIRLLDFGALSIADGAAWINSELLMSITLRFCWILLASAANKMARSRHSHINYIGA